MWIKISLLVDWIRITDRSIDTAFDYVFFYLHNLGNIIGYVLCKIVLNRGKNNISTQENDEDFLFVWPQYSRMVNDSVSLVVLFNILLRDSVNSKNLILMTFDDERFQEMCWFYKSIKLCPIELQKKREKKWHTFSELSSTFSLMCTRYLYLLIFFLNMFNTRFKEKAINHKFLHKLYIYSINISIKTIFIWNDWGALDCTALFCMLIWSWDIFLSLW